MDQYKSKKGGDKILIKQDKENENDPMQIKANGIHQEGYQRMITPAVIVSNTSSSIVTTKQPLMTTQKQITMVPATLRKDVTVIGLIRQQPNKWQKSHETYQVSLNLEDYFSMNTMVDFWEEKKKGTGDQGYQRSISKPRARAFARYTLKGNQSFSNYIFSIRDTQLKKELVVVKLNKDGITAEITIKKDCTVWIVDGSHRAFGINDSQTEIEADPQLMDSYQMPVSLTIGQTKREEVDQFIVENKEAKPMATDLADRCLFEMPEVAAELEKRGTITYADIPFVKQSLEICDIIRKNPNSQWSGKLRSPNSTPKQVPETTISEKGFADSLKPLIGPRMSPFHKATAQETADVLARWWSAWAAKCPQPFKPYNPAGHHPNDFVIQQNIGTQSLNKLLAKLHNDFHLPILNMQQSDFEKLIDIQDFTEDQEWMKSIGYWSKFGTNQKSFEDISEEMLDMISDQKGKVVTSLGGRPSISKLIRKKKTNP